MLSLEELRGIFAADKFAAAQGITIDDVSEERAVCSVTLRDDHKNGLGNAQGGLIFTLADFAFAVYANRGGLCAITLESTIRYIRPPKGTRLTASASARHEGRSVAFCECEVRDDLGTLVALASVTGYKGGR